MKIKLVTFCNSLIFFAPVALLVRTSQGITLKEFFILQMILSFSILVFEIPMGVVSDRLGHRRTLILSQWMILIARILLWYATSMEVFIAEAIIEAVGNSLSSGTLEAYIYADEPEKYAVKIAKIGNWGTFGFIISTVLYVPMMHWGKLNLLLAATVISSLAGAVLSFFIPENEEQEEENKEIMERKAFNFSWIPVKKVLLFSFINSVLSIGFLSVNFFYITKLTTSNIESEWMSVIILAYSAIQMLVPFLLKRLNKIRAVERRLFFLAVIADVLFMGLFWLNGMSILLPMLLIPTVLTAFSYILSESQNVFIDEIEGDEYRATILSVFSMGTNLCDFIFLGFSAVLTGNSGNVVFAITGNIILGVTFIYVLYNKLTVERNKNEHKITANNH